MQSSPAPQSFGSDSPAWPPQPGNAAARSGVSQFSKACGAPEDGGSTPPSSASHAQTPSVAPALPPIHTAWDPMVVASTACSAASSTLARRPPAARHAAAASGQDRGASWRMKLWAPATPRVAAAAATTRGRAMPGAEQN